jgi:hypothetical protein
MAVTVINTTDTLDVMRIKLNSLTANDFGDPALLTTTGLNATSVMGAIVQISQFVASTFAFNIKDSLNNTQLIGPGTNLVINGTNNQTTVSIGSGPTVTIGLPNTVTLTTQLNVSNLSLSSGSISSSGGNISFSNNNLITSGTLGVGALTATSYTSIGNITINTNKFTVAGSTGNTSIAGTLGVTGLTTLGGNLYLSTAGNIQFEGATNDAYKTTLTVADPTANRTITIPNITGTLITNSDGGTVTGNMIAVSTITNSNIADNTIRASKLNVAGDSITFNSVTATSFTGTASIASTVTVTPQNIDNNNYYVPFVASNSGNQALRTDIDLTYNPNLNILNTTSLSADYADLAEIYATDQQYEVGTVMMVGGSAEVTASSIGKRAIGVISENPAYLMNAKGTGQPIALKGKVKVKVNGFISKGDELIADNNGLACKVGEVWKEKIFAIALEDSNTSTGTSNIIQAIIL